MAKSGKIKLGGSGTMLASLLFSAAILPVVLMGTLNPDGLSFMTRADTPNEVRLWIEPAEVVTKPGSTFSVDVMAEFESETMIIPQISFDISHSDSIVVSPVKISYKEPFRGLVKVGTVNVKANIEGKFEMEPDTQSVFVELPDINIVTSKTLITSKR